MSRRSPFAAVMLGSALVALMALPAHAAFPVQTTPDSGGEGSVAQFDHNAYSLPLGNMSMTKRLDFSVGNSFFRNPWVEAPASTDARDGLGPLINTNSCQGCHIKDGRGHPPSGEERAVSLFLRLSLPAEGADAEVLKRQGINPLPHYGGQLQTAAITGFDTEADMQVSYTEKTITLDDGDVVSLRVPEYRIINPAYGQLPDELLTSATCRPAHDRPGASRSHPGRTHHGASRPRGPRW
ncbi:MAG: di-heme oxidoredictase family protein [Halomonas sp.]|uniref:di-heme oxidoredictase family protein n=1 Tax=Halomonas sp. TaxID=1486246 RepID=UPI002ACD3D24|nr:di-heme oxidoredictase family protein [Halomonas sp.]MDZ7851276.1 di-heme oxidoredictase family protein [Halomonas sp.]